MTFAQLWKSIKTTWQSRPFAIILPIVALGWYWFKHGHIIALATVGNGGSLPTWPDLVTFAALLATKFERLTALFVGEHDPATLPPPVVAPILVKPPGPPPVVVALLLAMCLGLSACKTVNTPDAGGPPTPVQVAEDCAVGVLHTSALAIIADVGVALASKDWSGLLSDLVTRFGLPAVDCAVQEVAGESNHNAQVSGDSLSTVKAQRGRQWLVAHPVAP